MTVVSKYRSSRTISTKPVVDVWRLSQELYFFFVHAVSLHPSLSVSSLPIQTGSLLRDWRRVNVALTRAKHKLLLIGSSSTLRHAPLLQCLIDMLKSRQQVFNLPSDASVKD